MEAALSIDVNTIRRRLQEEISRLEREISHLETRLEPSTAASFASEPLSNISPTPNVSRVVNTEPSQVLSHVSPVNRNSREVSWNHPPQLRHPNYKIPFPPFASKNVEMWFWTVEKWFASMLVDDDNQQFFMVLLALPSQAVAVFKNQFDAPPSSDKYLFIKRLISAHFSRNQFDRIKALVTEADLGDRKPSELYAEMRDLAGSAISHEALKGLWILRLPEQMRPSLAFSSNDPVDFLRAADLMYEVTARNNIGRISNPTVCDSNYPAHNCSENIPQSCAAVRKSNFDKSKRHLPVFSSKNHQCEASTPNDNPFCFYHSMFGNKARKCRLPCKWNLKNRESDS